MDRSREDWNLTDGHVYCMHPLCVWLSRDPREQRFPSTLAAQQGAAARRPCGPQTSTHNPWLQVVLNAREGPTRPFGGMRHEARGEPCTDRASQASSPAGDSSWEHRAVVLRTEPHKQGTGTGWGLQLTLCRPPHCAAPRPSPT